MQNLFLQCLLTLIKKLLDEGSAQGLPERVFLGDYRGNGLGMAYVLPGDCLAHMYPCRVPRASPYNTQANRLPFLYHYATICAGNIDGDQCYDYKAGAFT